MKKKKFPLAIIALTATLNAGTISIGYGPNGNIGGYSISSPDPWAQSIAANYAPSARQGGGFLSFCLELNEHFTPGQYYSYSISDAAVRGGESVSDPISVGTGYLYSLFAMGSLPGSTTELQRAIWQLEGEIPISPNAFNAVLTAKFGSLATAALDSYQGQTAASYGVQVINVGTPPRYAGQDQLVYSRPVNVPDSGGLGSVYAIALAALAALKRKMSR